MSKSQRTKGAAGEREWCAELARLGVGKAQRALGQARDGGGDVPLPPFLFEVKRRRGLAVRQFLDQAVEARPQYPGCEIAAVAMREDGRTGWMVLLSASDFATLVKQARGMGWHLPKEML